MLQCKIIKTLKYSLYTEGENQDTGTSGENKEIAVINWKLSNTVNILKFYSLYSILFFYLNFAFFMQSCLK